MRQESPRKGNVITRLIRNQAGNTLAITAAAIIPLLAIVGSGIDISRLYLAKTRLQQACDASALAGRKAMSGMTWTTSSKDSADNFFRTNFPDGKFGTNTPTISYSISSTGAVTGTATVVVPMTLMAIFNAEDSTLSVQCTADLQLPNTDVMFVLDTTLSMNDTNPGDAKSRIAVLRDAVQNFYSELQAVKPVGSQIRYGFVPYSSTVNVGTLLKPGWLQDNPVYDSREEDGTSIKPGSTQGATITQTELISTSGRSYTGERYQGQAEKCAAPANALSDTSVYTSWTPSSSAVPRERTRTRTRNGTTYSASLSNGICWITPTHYDNLVEVTRERVIPNPNAGETGSDSTIYHWIYKPIPYSIASMKSSLGSDGAVNGGSFVAKVANNHANRTITWNKTNACIEERATRRSDENATVPRHDMDVDLVPDPAKPETQWKPFLPGLVYGRNSTSVTGTAWQYSASPATYTRVVTPNATTNYVTPSSSANEYGACPTYARKLSTLTASELTTYLAALKAAGFTYHDIGMLWGLRLMSPDGIFGTENKAAEASGKVARHLIFMTDGETDTRFGAYDAWGQSAVTRRRTPIGAAPTNAQQNAITETRLRELCTLAKTNKNITVWVIAFGTDLTSLLSDCASPGRAFQADDAAQLTATFSMIASQIAQLRIIR